jgi:type IV fimbrial biogenesis protein FimT
MPVSPVSRQYSVPLRSSGITLVELLFVLAIVGIITGLALPAYSDAVARARVKSAAESIYGLMQQARSEAPIRDANLSVTVNSAHWCVGISDIANCDCTLATGATACTLNVAGQKVLHRVLGDEFDQVAVSENFPGVRTTFSPIRRNASPAGTVTVSSNGQEMQIKIGLIGRIRLCSATGTAILGYPPC